MKRIIIFILLLMPIAKAEIIITEIMADPIADETLNEWVELYNNGTEPIEVKGWTIGDDKDNDTIEGGLYNKEGTIIPPQSYAIITDKTTRVYNNFNINSETIGLYVDDSSIGNGLKNEGEKLWLYTEEGLVQEVGYPKVEEGKTWSYSNGSWAESEPTPGYSNIQRLGCDWKVEILTNKTFVEEPEFKIKLTKIYGEKNSLTLNRRIKNLFEEIIKEYTTLEVENVLNHRTYDYSPNLKTNNAYIIEAEINSSCDTNPENDKIREVIFVQSEKPKEESELEITQVYDLGTDKEAEWGQTIKIRLKAYKGNTNKKTINLWSENKNKEKASKQTSVNVETKYLTTELTVPIQLKPNCNKKLKNGEYKIVAEGLDARAVKKIRINGEAKEICQVIKEVVKENKTQVKCPDIKTEQCKYIEPTMVSKESKTYLNDENTTKISGSVVYESKDKKAKKLGIYFYASLMIIITIASILRK